MDLRAEYVRHPANGGATKFDKGWNCLWAASPRELRFSQTGNKCTSDFAVMRVRNNVLPRSH